MRDVLLKKRRKTKLFYNARLIILGLIAIFMVTSSWKVYQKNRESRANLATAQIELVNLKNKEAELKANYAKLQTEKGKDEEIRKKFSVTKDGEEITVIVDDKTPPVVEQVKPNFWNRLLASVKSIF